MGKKKKKKDRAQTPPNSPGLGGLGDLLIQAGLEASEPSDEPAPPPEKTVSPARPRAPRRIAIQTSRKGRKGHTVTLIRHLPDEDLEAWTQAARRALGCGAKVEGNMIVLQGDLGDRAAEWFTAQGVQQVSR